ncbi:hypothetical protein ACIA8F_17685 [Streptomyces sp. NPDC051563]|uniref:hypothetical protein n=1 Tax=Streptomyces sp. NPDC051563 TaxID=3365659 RepID=UPI0037925D3B
MEMQTWRDGRAKATDATEAIRAALASLGLPGSAWGGNIDKEGVRRPPGSHRLPEGHKRSSTDTGRL